MPQHVTTWPQFDAALMERRAELSGMIPATLQPSRFFAALSAVVRGRAKTRQDLLECDSRSLFAAVVKAAQDGILPDGKQGAIVRYGREATWMPMIAGLRLRAKQLANIDIVTNIVREGDDVVIEEGDRSSFMHRPIPFSRAEIVGVYALFKIDGTLQKWETMNVDEIEVVKSLSRKDRDGNHNLMWESFWGEGARKAVARRGLKEMALIPPELDTIIGRDDEHYAIEGDAARAGPTPRPAGRAVMGRRAPTPIVHSGAADIPDVAATEHRAAAAHVVEPDHPAASGGAPDEPAPAVPAVPAEPAPDPPPRGDGEHGDWFRDYDQAARERGEDDE